MPYDLVVIGSGPAGEKAAAKAAYFGRKVAVVERGPAVGGQCVKGGLPSKVLRESALAYSGARRQLVEVFERPERRRLQMASFLRAVGSVCDAREGRVRGNLERHGIEVVEGAASLASAHEVRVKPVAAKAPEQLLSTEFIVVATGSRPMRPSFIPFDDRSVFCSDTILTMKELPRSMIVIGGGAIGAEYASIFAALDVEVNLLEERGTLLEFLDEEIGRHLSRELARRGVALHMGESVRECTVQGPGRVRVVTSRGTPLDAEVVLFAGGRLSNTEGLGLEAAGVRVGDKGRPLVDDSFRTSAPNIYAVGDVIGFPALASTSMEQGRIAVGHALRLEETGRPDVFEASDVSRRDLPYGIYTIPSVSMFGKTEQGLRAEGRDVVVGRAHYRDQDRGRLNGDVDGMLKIVCDRSTRKLLGVHIVGEGAEELVHIGQACMQLGGSVEFFLRTVFNFPTMSSLYKAAAYDVVTQLGSGSRSP